ncbi:ABC transporter permease [Streptosporangium sp. NPDC000563]|uniref:ABC transporter permease n=1 Tax=Streptosporangium sp. NPDC000563 TaxID=3154366 RepID=UPI00332C38A2
MKALAIGMVNLRRVFSDRTNIFFVIVAPFLMVFVLGQMFGVDQQLRLGVVSGPGPLTQQLVGALGSGERVTVERIGDESALRTAVERGELRAGVVVPADYDARIREGGQVEVRYLTRQQDPGAAEIGTWVRSVVPQQAALLRAARFGQQEGAGSFDESLSRAGQASVAEVQVRVTTTGRSLFPEGFNPFAASAPPLLLLFTFLTSLTAAIGLVETRLLGVARRMYATPISARAIVAGEALGRMVIALTQALLIMLGSALIFGVDWGDPPAAAALVVVFSLVGSGAAMLLGSAFKTPGAVISVAMILGLGLAALGGSMLPLESFGGVMQVVAHLTPHAWAYEAFAELVRNGGTIVDILPQFGVLSCYAAVLFALGVWRLRRVLTR